MHCLILGTTGAGKSTLARELVRMFGPDRCLIHDPLLSEWHGAETHADSESFLAAFHASRSRHCFVDESLEVAGHHDRDMIVTATRGRHYGNRCWYLSQRAAGLSVTLRAQCSSLFLFRVRTRDAEAIADDFDDDGLLASSRLPPYVFLHKTRFGKVRKFALEKGHSP